MRILGLPIPFTRQKAANLASVADNRGWFRIFESWPGAWQHNVVVDRDLALSYHAVFACMTLIASDIAKLRVKYVEKDKNGIWSEVANPAYDPVLRKPNTYQNRIQFWETWVLSKLSRGNTYVLKVRDGRGVVAKLMVLDPNRVIPLVADSGDVYYRLDSDNIVGIENSITVPASEIIHDRFNCLFHPLVGLSPLYAAGVAAMQGSRIQSNSTWFFGNKSQPGGILTAAGAIDDSTALRLKEAWETKFTGENAGKIAVVGDGLKYEAIGMSAHDSQLIEQLKWTSEVICSVFHVPPYKIGVGQMPSYNNIQSLNVEYYSQCLQSHIEAGELCLDEGLEIKNGAGTEFDLDGLLRMDSVAQMEVLDKAKGKMTPNEQRKKLDLKPVKGGDTVYMQEQDHSLEALAKRDAREDPFSKTPATASEPPANDNMAEQAASALVEIYKGLRR